LFKEDEEGLAIQEINFGPSEIKYEDLHNPLSLSLSPLRRSPDTPKTTFGFCVSKFVSIFVRRER
jgi:hypothetical protein